MKSHDRPSHGFVSWISILSRVVHHAFDIGDAQFEGEEPLRDHTVILTFTPFPFRVETPFLFFSFQSPLPRFPQRRRGGPLLERQSGDAADLEVL